MNDNFFVGQNILVTGATSGIGFQLTKTLLEKNAIVSACGRNVSMLNELHDAATIGSLHVISVNLTEEKSIDDLIDASPELNGIVLNAGVIDYTPAKLISKKKITDIFSINFDANVLLVQKLLKKKKISKNGSIVFVSSVSSLLGVPGTALYAASKAALTSYARVLASELALQKIRVNIVSPGIVQTGIIQQKEVQTESAYQESEKKYPLGFGQPDDVCSLIMFLLSNEAKWITGSNIIIDGGHLL